MHRGLSMFYDQCIEETILVLDDDCPHHMSILNVTSNFKCKVLF